MFVLHPLPKGCELAKDARYALEPKTGRHFMDAVVAVRQCVWNMRFLHAQIALTLKQRKKFVIHDLFVQFSFYAFI